MSVEIRDIDLGQLEAEVRRLAAENPNYRYPHTNGCVYVERGPGGGLCGSCLFGVALINLGVDPQELDLGDHVAIALLLDRNGFAGPQIEWFQAVQNFQDDRRPWGEAVRLADTYAGTFA